MGTVFMPMFIPYDNSCDGEVICKSIDAVTTSCKCVVPPMDPMTQMFLWIILGSCIFAVAATGYFLIKNWRM